MESDKLKQILEAALLAADEPLTVDQFVKMLAPSEEDREAVRASIREALKTLEGETEGRGYELKRVASGYRYQVRQELSPWISRLWEEKPPRYTRALLETLALVAYKQPVTRGDIEQVRGVSVSQNIMRTLLERGWIRVVGQREVPGRPAMYGTTREFLDYFDLKSLDQLPPLAEIRALIEPVLVEEAELEALAGAELEAAADAGQIAGEEEEELITVSASEISALAVAEEEDGDGEPVTLDDFDAEIAAAIEAADAVSARFSIEPLETESPGVGEDESDDPEAEEQPTAEVVQLPRAPH